MRLVGLAGECEDFVIDSCLESVLQQLSSQLKNVAVCNKMEFRDIFSVAVS